MTNENYNKAEIIIAKQRHGPIGSIKMHFDANYTIWMDTIKEGRFDDTNKMFEAPTNYDFKVNHKDAAMWAFLIKQDILDKHGSLGPHSK